jgi:hypothetical protein
LESALAEDWNFVTCSTLSLFRAVNLQRHSGNKSEFRTELKVSKFLAYPLSGNGESFSKEKLEFCAQPGEGFIGHWKRAYSGGRWPLMPNLHFVSPTTTPPALLYIDVHKPYPYNFLFR